jgi:hypothetical protein
MTLDRRRRGCRVTCCKTLVYTNARRFRMTTASSNRIRIKVQTLNSLALSQCIKGISMCKQNPQLLVLLYTKNSTGRLFFLRNARYPMTQEISSPQQVGLFDVPTEALGLLHNYLGPRQWHRMREVCQYWKCIVSKHTGKTFLFCAYQRCHSVSCLG